eukprot:Gb_32036 [translate_table: standard]
MELNRGCFVGLFKPPGGRRKKRIGIKVSVDHVSEKKYPVRPSDYKLYDEVGEGVTATVYKALCIPFNEIVAIKVVDLDNCNTVLDGIYRGVRTMSLINHPNVLRAHCSFVVDYNLWVVMPYMAGGSCLNIMKTTYSDGFEELVIATLLRQVLKALEYLHSHGQIHRNIKAGNILVGASGAVTLDDFGVSVCMFDIGDRESYRSTFRDTPCRMAPEVKEQHHGYDFKNDIWSFGITALELSHGHDPFIKYPPIKVLHMALQNEPQGLDYEKHKRYSKSFLEMIAMCLVKDPTKRPSAKKLLKHSFFKNAQSNEFVAHSIFDGLPPLADRLRASKLREGSMRRQKGLPYGENNERSQNEHKQGISARNFDLEDLKAQASLIDDNDELPAARVHIENPRLIQGSDDLMMPPSCSNSPINSIRLETTEYDGGHTMRSQSVPVAASMPVQSLNELKEHFDVFEGDVNSCSPLQRESVKLEGSRPEELQTQKDNAEKVQDENLEKECKLLDDSQCASVESHRVLSGALIPEHELVSYVGPAGDTNRDTYRHQTRFERNFSEPSTFHRVNVIHSTDCIYMQSKSLVNQDDRGEKPKGYAVQQKGRFKITSEDPMSMPTLSSSFATSVAIPEVLPHMQRILQHNIVQRDQIVNLIKYLSQFEASSAHCLNNLGSKSSSWSSNEHFMFEASSNREQELLQQVTRLQIRVANLVDELQKVKMKNVQLEWQLNAACNKEVEKRIQ